MVDALGGVSVCVEPSPAVAAASRPLPAGSSRLSGSQASAYLRPADAAADATGVEAALRAQLLLTSTLRAAASRSTLTSPVTLTRFLSRTAGALTVDQGTTLGDLRGLGSGLGSATAVQRAELPLAQVGYVPAGSKQSYVLLDTAATRSLFDQVIGRTRLPAGFAGGARPSSGDDAPSGGAGDAAPSPSPTAAPPAAPSAPVVSVAPQDVTVDVVNGTGTGGLAATVATALRGQGFAVGTVGNAPAAVPQTVVRYGPGAEAKAATVAAAVPGAVVQADPAGGTGLQLIIGPGYSSVVPVQVAPPAPAGAATSTAAASAAAAPKAAQAAACS
jgi:hypothetical protein